MARDFSRILSLVKAVAVLRHRWRQRDDRGRLVADIGDYATVCEIVGDVFRGSVSGASERVRELVKQVGQMRQAALRERVTVTTLAAALRISKMTTSRRVDVALRNNWLINRSKGRPFDLDLGEPLPPEPGLPAPEVVAGVTV